MFWSKKVFGSLVARLSTSRWIGITPPFLKYIEAAAAWPRVMDLAAENTRYDSRRPGGAVRPVTF